MERLINILVIDDNPTNIDDLKEILAGGGNNLIFCNNEKAAIDFINQRRIGIILINIHAPNIDGFHLLSTLKMNSRARNAFKIIINNDAENISKLVQGFKKGAVDYLPTPFNPELVKAKIEVLKSNFFKTLRINQLLRNIFPPNVLEELDTKGKFTPKKVDKGVVLFTDFVAFTKLSKNIKPIELLKELEIYFKKFDDIIDRYKLEKIKTIGDAYMALAGVTETNSHPAIRAILAALEIRDFVRNKKQIALANNNNAWDIRIGLHSGPLVAGIIDAKKISFDVWGDTVNIASRAEQNSTANNITITSVIAEDIKTYFDIEYRGQVGIKYGDYVDMYFVNQLKAQYSLFNEGENPNRELRQKCDLFPMDFELARAHVLRKLKSNLPIQLDYHNIKHTLNVEKSAIRLGHIIGVSAEEMVLLRTAALFHDSGYIFQYEDNEKFGKQLAHTILPDYGYSAEQINIICEIIETTKREAEPKTLLQKIMCDADLDYLGRADYYIVARTLRKEMENYDQHLTDIEWVNFQLDYLENVHQYYTQTSKNIRSKGKWLRIKELKIKKVEYGS